MRELTLLSRSYCTLCEDMQTALESLQGRFASPFSVTVVDVDASPALEQKWGELVPVLLLGDQEICHYFLDESALAAALA